MVTQTLIKNCGSFFKFMDRNFEKLSVVLRFIHKRKLFSIFLTQSPVNGQKLSSLIKQQFRRRHSTSSVDLQLKLTNFCEMLPEEGNEPQEECRATKIRETGIQETVIQETEIQEPTNLEATSTSSFAPEVRPSFRTSVRNRNIPIPSSQVDVLPKTRSMSVAINYLTRKFSDQKMQDSMPRSNSLSFNSVGSCSLSSTGTSVSSGANSSSSGYLSYDIDEEVDEQDTFYLTLVSPFCDVF